MKPIDPFGLTYSLWNVQVYNQGNLISIDIIEESEVQPMIQHFESEGYEVRSEPAWKPAHANYNPLGAMHHPHQQAAPHSSQESLT